MLEEDELLPISALQHYLYCTRQFALIYLEQSWTENRFTAEGRIMHEKAHEGDDESRPGVRITRGLPIRSLAYGLTGQCDVVEFHHLPSQFSVEQSPLPRTVEIVPVEYKRGRPKINYADEVQLCAQALCLEEMFHLEHGVISLGYLFYGQKRRRTEVTFGDGLRELTAQTAEKAHAVLTSGQTPRAQYDKELCSACSLLRTCEPKAMTVTASASTWFEKQLQKVKDEEQTL